MKLYLKELSITGTFDTLEEAQTYRDSIRANKSNDKLERAIKEERMERVANKDFTLHAALEKYKKSIDGGLASKNEETARISKMQRMQIAKLNFYSLRQHDIYLMLDEIGGSSENKRIYTLLLGKVFKKSKK